MADTADSAGEITLIDPRAPRFGQLITAVVLGLGIVTQRPGLIFLITFILMLAVASGWRFDVYAILWNRGIRRFMAPPEGREAAAPHRFAKVLGVGGTILASTALVAGIVMGSTVALWAGYVMAGVIGLLAAVAGIGNYCVGCKMYRQVGYVRRLGIV